ncbi:hypothetical protein K501DRAFT_159450, partial [Backusella circina FSU 941]
KLSRKNPTDAVSVKMWMDSFSGRGDHSLYHLHPDGGPFLVSFMTKWQLKLLSESEEWCIDSTHKTCRSFTDPTQDAYLFSIVVRLRTTNKGAPVCFFHHQH